MYQLQQQPDDDEKCMTTAVKNTLSKQIIVFYPLNPETAQPEFNQ